MNFSWFNLTPQPVNSPIASPLAPVKADPLKDYRMDDGSENTVTTSPLRNLREISTAENIGLAVRYNPTLSRCINIIQTSFGGINYKTTSNSKEQRALLNAIENPLLYSSKQELISILTWQQILHGSVYIRVSKSINGTLKGAFEIEILPRENWTIQKDLVTGEIGLSGYSQDRFQSLLGVHSPIKFIPFIKDPQQFATLEVNQSLAILYTPASFDYSNPYCAILPCLSPAHLQLLQQNEISVMLANKPITPSIISIEPPAFDVNGSSLQSIYKAMIARLSKGGNEKGKHILTEGKVEVHSLSNNTSDFLNIETYEQSGKDIALALGIPFDLLGIGNGTYENKAWANIEFEEMIIASYASPFINALSKSLIANDGKGLEVDTETLDKLRSSTGATQGNQEKTKVNK